MKLKLKSKIIKKQNKSVSPISNRNLDKNNNSKSNNVLKNTSDDDEINFYYL